MYITSFIAYLACNQKNKKNLKLLWLADISIVVFKFVSGKDKNGANTSTRNSITNPIRPYRFYHTFPPVDKEWSTLKRTVHTTHRLYLAELLTVHGHKLSRTLSRDKFTNKMSLSVGLEHKRGNKNTHVSEISPHFFSLCTNVLINRLCVAAAYLGCV